VRVGPGDRHHGPERRRAGTTAQKRKGGREGESKGGRREATLPRTRMCGQDGRRVARRLDAGPAYSSLGRLGQRRARRTDAPMSGPVTGPNSKSQADDAANWTDRSKWCQGAPRPWQTFYALGLMPAESLPRGRAGRALSGPQGSNSTAAATRKPSITHARKARIGGSLPGGRQSADNLLPRLELVIRHGPLLLCACRGQALPQVS
jgi:hypothetical protein